MAAYKTRVLEILSGAIAGSAFVTSTFGGPGEVFHGIWFTRSNPTTTPVVNFSLTVADPDDINDPSVALSDYVCISSDGSDPSATSIIGVPGGSTTIGGQSTQWLHVATAGRRFLGNNGIVLPATASLIVSVTGGSWSSATIHAVVSQYFG